MGLTYYNAPLSYDWVGKGQRHYQMEDGKYAVRFFEMLGWCVCEAPATLATVISHGWSSVTEALEYAEKLRREDEHA